MEKKKTGKKNLIVVVIFFSVFVLIGAGLFVYNTVTRFSYEKHLEDAVISIDDEQITLREFGYYILLMERDTQVDACIYDSENPTNYWNLYIGTYGEVGYIRELSKEAAVNYCMRDHIYLKLMQDNAYQFSKEELETMEQEGYEQLSCFTKEQLDAVGLSEEAFLEQALQVSMVHEYLKSFTEEGISALELDVEGEYYEQLKATYSIQVDEELLHHLSFGSITVNRK